MQNEITWFQKLGSEQDPFAPNPARGEWFFETPALASHINTLLNVAGNGEFIGLVKGEQGVGKTSLLNRLEERLRDRENISFTRITCSQGCSLIQALGLSSGLSDEELAYEPRKRLIEHLTRLRTAGQTVVAAIDDAHLLSPQDLALLIRIALSPNNENLINTILFAEADIEARLWLSAINDPLPLDRLYTLVLTPLSADQTGAYLEHRLQAAGLTQLSFSNTEVGAIHRKSRGLPAATNSEASARLQRRTRSLWARGLKLPGRPAVYGLAGVVAVAALAGVAVWQWPELLPSAQDPTPDLAVAVQDPSTITAPLPLPLPDEPVAQVDAPPLPTLRPQETPPPAEPAVVVTDEPVAEPVTALPPVNPAVVEAAAVTDEPAPVVKTPVAAVPEPAVEPDEPSAVATEAPPPIALAAPSLDAARTAIPPSPTAVAPLAVEPPAAEPDKAAQTPPVTAAEPATPVRIPESKPKAPPKPKVVPPPPLPVVTAAVTPLPAAVREPKPAPAAEIPRAVQLNDVRRDDWFRQRNPGEYVIQIVSSSQEQALREFIAQRRFPTTPGYFRSNQNGREWYALVLGPYGSEAAARAALSNLPAVLKKNSPWIRSMASIQAAMSLER